MMPIAVLAGGYATRLGSLVKDTPKCLIEINGRPFVDWQLDLLVKNGYKKFVFCLSHKSSLIQEHLGDGSNRGVNIRYSLDGETQLGTGGALKKALPILGSNFGVLYGDSFLPINYLRVEQEFLNCRSYALMTVYKNQNRFDASNVEFTDGKLVNYEKGQENKRMHYIDYGLSFFRRDAFNRWRDQSSFDLSSLFNQLAREQQLDGYEVSERFYEIGSVQGIQEFSNYLRKVPSGL
jgi:MurNAc alpha-1-phosphate uridylyltransferase